MTGTLKDVHISDWLKIASWVFACGIFVTTVSMGMYSKADGVALKGNVDLQELRITNLEKEKEEEKKDRKEMKDAINLLNTNVALIAQSLKAYQITPPQ